MAKYQTWHVWVEVRRVWELPKESDYVWNLYTVEAPDKYDAISQAATYVAEECSTEMRNIPIRAYAYDVGFANNSTKTLPLNIVSKTVFEVQRLTIEQAILKTSK